MQPVAQKVVTAKGIYRSRGLKGLAIVIPEILGITRLARRIRRWWNKNDHWLFGKLVEIRGNRVSIDGCVFEVKSKVVSTPLKSRLALDRYESAERYAIKEFLDPGLPVVEFGGGIGVVSCLTNRRLLAPEKHVVVEANPHLVPLIVGNRDQNGCIFTVVHAALAYGSDEVTFYVDDEFVASGVQRRTNHAITVPTVTLGSILERFGFERCTLICDIEGGEVELIQIEKSLLGSRVETIIVEVHENVVGRESLREMFVELQRLGFTAIYRHCDTFVLRNERNGATTRQPIR